MQIAHIFSDSNAVKGKMVTISGRIHGRTTSGKKSGRNVYGQIYDESHPDGLSFIFVGGDRNELQDEMSYSVSGVLVHHPERTHSIELHVHGFKQIRI